MVSKFWKFKSKEPPDWVDPELEKDHIDYPQYPLIGGHELNLVLKEMRKSLPKVMTPTLILHSKNDQSVSSAHPRQIFAKLGTKDKVLIWLERSGHVISRDVEKERVLEEIDTFLQRVLHDHDQGASPPARRE
jgi:carboxylesterase